MRESNLKLYSLGIVTKDKKPGDDFIEVCPIEEFNIQESGTIDEKNKTSKSSLKDSNDKGFDTEVQSKNVISAKWISFGLSNRTTAPDVYKNETVILFKFADVNEYFWTTIFREPNIRRLETVLYQYSNKRSGLDPYDLKSSYYNLIDTRGKKIHIHTSNNDGELTTYDIKLDTKKGYLEIKDGKGNFIKLDSASDSVTITTNNNIVANTKNFTINAQNTTINTTNFNLNASSSSVNSTLNITGPVNISSNLTVPSTKTQVDGCCSCC